MWLFYATARQLQDVSTAWAVSCLQMRTPDACQGRQAKSPGSGCNGTLRLTKFWKFDDFLKKLFKSDVDLSSQHEFTKYQSRKIIESVYKQSPRGGKKKRNVEKVRETSQNRGTVAYALISTVPIAVCTKSACLSNYTTELLCRTREPVPCHLNPIRRTGFDSF